MLFVVTKPEESTSGIYKNIVECLIFSCLDYENVSIARYTRRRNHTPETTTLRTALLAALITSERSSWKLRRFLALEQNEHTILMTSLKTMVRATIYKFSFSSTMLLVNPFGSLVRFEGRF